MAARRTRKLIGDGGSEEDLEHSLRFVDALRASRPGWQLRCALDCGAGVGHVTKHVLLRRCERVCLVEPDKHWLTQSRRYLGKKRALRCAFVGERIEEHMPSCAWEASRKYDLVWVQWTLQYLIDAHVVACLEGCARRSRARTASSSSKRTGRRASRARMRRHHRLQSSMPPAPRRRPRLRPSAFASTRRKGLTGGTMWTRPDAHHRWLFRCAGLRVEACEHCINGECTAWALAPMPATSPEMAESTLLEQPKLQPAV